MRAEQAGGPLPSGCRRRRMQRRTEVIPADTGAARKVFQSDDLGLTFYTSLVPKEKKIKKNLDPWDEVKGMCHFCVRRPVVFTGKLFQLDSLSEFGAANLQDKKFEVLNQEMREERPKRSALEVRIDSIESKIMTCRTFFFAERKVAKYNMKHVKP